MPKTTYEIYIDESGLFEISDKPQPPVRLIGGVIVPPVLKTKETELEIELSDIRKKYFPRKKRIHISDEDLSKETQDQLRTEIHKIFIRLMQDAKIAFIFDLSKLDEDPTHSGARLYRNMLVHLLQILVYYHPLFEKDAEIVCNLAQRRFPYLEKYEDFLSEKGYLKLKDAKGGKTEFTAITQVELDDIMTAVRKTLRFSSQRRDNYDVEPYNQWRSPFMEVADWACNTIRYLLLTSSTADELYKNLTSKFGDGRLAFYCPSDYDWPENILTTFHQGRMGEFLTQYIDLAQMRATSSRYNDNLLLKPAVQNAYRQLQQTEDCDECRWIVALADTFLNNKDFYRLDDIKLLIQLVRKRFESIAEGTPDPKWDQLAFRYHDVCIRYCNHTANLVEGKTHRAKALKIYERLSPKDFTMVRSFHELLNRISIWDANEFAFERANVVLEPLKAREESLTEILSLGENQIFGKICGSMGQNYAFMGLYDQARLFLEKAATHLGRTNLQQISYRAHLALELEDRSAYHAEMALLFKKDNFPGFARLLQECLNSLPKASFELHLILKGMLTFPEKPEEQDRLAYQIFRKVEPWLRRYREAHPWELVWITLGRLLLNSGDADRGRRCWKAAANFTEDSNKLTFVMIGHSAHAWEALSWLKEGNLEKARKTLQPVADTFTRLKRTNIAPGIFNPNLVADEDGKVREGWFNDVGLKLLKELDLAQGAMLKSLCEQFLAKFTFNYW